MKVTKAIREYITDKINALYVPKFDALRKEEKELVDRYENAIVRFKQKCNELDMQFKDQLQEEFGFTTSENKFVCECNLSRYRFERTDPAWKEHMELKKNLENQCQKSIRDAIVMLELGGTKSELDEVLAKIEEELA